MDGLPHRTVGLYRGRGPPLARTACRRGWVDRVAGALIATKMSVPRTSQDLVSRLRLDELLVQAQHARLTLVSGPAGFGKNTLIAGRMGDVMQEGSAVAWLSLDGDDDDPERFWR